MSPRAASRLESLGFAEVYDYAAGEADWFASGLPREGRDAAAPRVGDAARRDVPTCGPDERIGAVQERVRAAGWRDCAVVNDRRILLGRLGERALGADAAETAEAVMEPGPSTFRPDVPLDELLAYLREHDLSRGWITTSDGRLVGLLLREGAAHALHRADRG